MPSTLTVGGAWFVTSAVASTYANTAFLRAFPDPLAHMLVRFGGAAAVGLAANAVAPKGGKGKPGSHIPPSEFPRVARAMLVPALCLLCANFANSVALQLSGITLCYIVKATIPVWTVAWAVLGAGARFPPSIYASLVPTVVGVALASFGDLDFHAGGLAAALASTLAQTALNLASKPAIARAGLDGRQAFGAMAAVNTLVAAPLYVLRGSSEGVFGSALGALQAGDTWPATLVAVTALAYLAEYSLNFVFVGLVSPVAFSGRFS